MQQQKVATPRDHIIGCKGVSTLACFIGAYVIVVEICVGVSLRHLLHVNATSTQARQLVKL